MVLNTSYSVINLDFLQVILSTVLYDDWMTFLPDFGAVFHHTVVPTHQVDSE